MTLLLWVLFEEIKRLIINIETNVQYNKVVVLLTQDAFSGRWQSRNTRRQANRRRQISVYCEECSGNEGIDYCHAQNTQ